MMWRILAGAACALCVVGGVVDSMKHDIVPITPKSFDSQIGKFRNSNVAALLLHGQTDADRIFVDDKFNKLAKDIKGVARMAAIDCVEFKTFCENEWNVKAAELPKIVILPPNPLPHSIHEGSIEDLEKVLLRLVPRQHVTALSQANVESFFATAVSVPKVVLISTKPNASPLFHAVANSLSDRMSFGVVSTASNDSQPLIARFQATKKSLPAIALFKGSSGVPEFYRGKLRYEEIFDWLNVHSETFVRGGGFSEEISEEKARPWLLESVPEVTRESHGDVCFKGNRGLCLIYLREGPLEEAERAMLLDASNRAVGLGSRGSFMWMDLSKHPHFRELFALSSPDLPTLAVFNPSKRLRFALAGRPARTVDDAMAFLDQIAGGLKFTVVKGRKLPKFGTREEL